MKKLTFKASDCNTVIMVTDLVEIGDLVEFNWNGHRCRFYKDVIVSVEEVSE